jgi:hypothetical protein
MLPSEKYFNGEPATSWTTCTIRGSRRIFPRPENATIAAKSIEQICSIHAIRECAPCPRFEGPYRP